MNVSELIDVLQTLPPDAPVGVLSITPVGVGLDFETAPVVTVERTLADDGTPTAVWITGIGESPTPPPTLVTWPCPCGETVTVEQHSIWPDDHDAHLTRDDTA